VTTKVGEFNIGDTGMRQPITSGNTEISLCQLCSSLTQIFKEWISSSLYMYPILFLDLHFYILIP